VPERSDYGSLVVSDLFQLTHCFIATLRGRLTRI
jgi:hypothetical protein